jgi:hypothetical protein
MTDKKGQYPRLPEDDEYAHEEQQTLLTQSFQPPPYTPSTAPSSPYIEPHQAATIAGSTPGPSSGLYPQIYNSSAPQQPVYQPTYQHPKFVDTSKPPPPVDSLFLMASHHEAPHQHQQQQAGFMSSPLVLMKPPSRIEDLRSKPGVVVCQHCNYLVLTETTPENGKESKPENNRQKNKKQKEYMVLTKHYFNLFMIYNRFMHIPRNPWIAVGRNHDMWLLSVAPVHDFMQGYNAFLSKLPRGYRTLL